MRAPQVFLLLVLCLGMAELAVWKGLNPKSFERTFDEVQREDVHVSPAEIDLGDVAIGETRSVSVRVTNRKDRPIQLRQPQSSCGCIRFELERPLSISAGETVQLALDYTAPKIPVAISKNVLLRVTTAQSAWRIPIKGSVVAESWASPPKHVVTNDDRKFGRIHFAEDRRVADILISHPDKIKVTLCPPSSNAQSYHVQVIDDAEGEGYVAFVDASENCLATVPIQWQQPRVIACEPKLVVLNPNSSSKIDKWNVVILRDPKKTGNPTVDAVVSWVKIASQEVVSDDVIKFSLEVDRALSPGRYDGEIVRVTDKRSGQIAVLKGRI